MSRIPRRRSRPIDVFGERYRWMVGSGKSRLIGDSGPILVLTVQRDGRNPGGIMQASLSSRLWTKEHSENLDCAPGHKASLVPSEVKKLVEHALVRGWDPSESRKFDLRWSTTAPALVDYKLEGEP